MSGRAPDPQVAIFQKSWWIYETILDRNYMFHRELFGEFRDFVKQRFPEPFSVADLGCGSARHMARALEGLPVVSYRGIDLSGPALLHARDNLLAVGIKPVLEQEDFLPWILKDKTPHDLLFSAFALHHLQSDQKRKFFVGARQSLAPRGCFFLIDVVRDEGEDREIYLDRYCSWMGNEWSVFSPEDCQEIATHIRAHDLPETLSEYRIMAMDAGFAPVRELCRFGWHRALLFEGC